MNRFELLIPKTLSEAEEALTAKGELVRPWAGGTALMLMMKSKLIAPKVLVALQALKPELSGMALDDEGNLRLGSMTTLRELELSPLVRQFSPAMSHALRTLSNVRVRNVATLGGHLAHADPHQDLPAILLALDASVRVHSRTQERWIPLKDLIKGYYQTSLVAGELITEVMIPPKPPGYQGFYLKETALTADDWPVIGVCAFVHVSEGVIQAAQIALGAVSDRPLRLSAVEALLIGQTATPGLLAKAGELASQGVQPLEDLRGSEPYKRELVRVAVRRTLEKVLGWHGKGGNQGGNHS